MRFISPTQAATIYGNSADFWRTRARTGRIRAIRLGRRWALDTDSLAEYEGESLWVPVYANRHHVYSDRERSRFERARREIGR